MSEAAFCGFIYQQCAAEVVVQTSMLSLLADHVARIPRAAAIVAPSVELLCQALASLLHEVSSTFLITLLSSTDMLPRFLVSHEAMWHMTM